MKKNMSNADRILRIVFAAIIAILFFAGIFSKTAGIIFLIIAAIFLITGFTSFCPIYGIFGINTDKHQTKETAE